MTEDNSSIEQQNRQDGWKEINYMLYGPSCFQRDTFWTSLIRPFRKREGSKEKRRYYLQEEAMTLSVLLHFNHMRACEKSKWWFVYTIEEGAIFSRFKERKQQRHLEILKECGLIKVKRADRVHGERKVKVNRKLLWNLMQEVREQAEILSELDNSGRKNIISSKTIYELFRIRFMYDTEEMMYKEIEITTDILTAVTEPKPVHSRQGVGSTPVKMTGDYGSTKESKKKNPPTSRSSPPGGGSGRSDGKGDTKETRNPKSLPPFPTPPKASKASSKDLEEIDKADSPPAAQDGSSSAKDIAVAFHEGLNKRGLLTLNCKKPSTIPSWIKTIREIISYIKERDHTTLSKASTYLMELIQYHVEHIGEEYHPDFRSPTKLKGEHLNKLESAMKRNKKAGISSSQEVKLKIKKYGGGKESTFIPD